MFRTFYLTVLLSSNLFYCVFVWELWKPLLTLGFMVAEEGLEPPTRGLWFRCSNHLSYSAVNKIRLKSLAGQVKPIIFS